MYQLGICKTKDRCLGRFLSHNKVRKIIYSENSRAIPRCAARNLNLTNKVGEEKLDVVYRALVDLALDVDVNWEYFEKGVQVIDKDKQNIK